MTSGFGNAVPLVVLAEGAAGRSGRRDASGGSDDVGTFERPVRRCGGRVSGFGCRGYGRSGCRGSRCCGYGRSGCGTSGCRGSDDSGIGGFGCGDLGREPLRPGGSDCRRLNLPSLDGNRKR